MAKHNYSQYSNNRKTAEVETHQVEAPVEETVIPVVEVETPEVKMEPKKEVKPKTAKGVVTGCTKLNVRKAPDSTAEVVHIINVNTKVEINMTKSTKEWFRVHTDAGVDGYCMRKFVDARL